jgi:hypothetical protein
MSACLIAPSMIFLFSSLFFRSAIRGSATLVAFIVPSGFVRVLFCGSFATGTHHLGNGGDGIPVTGRDRHAEEPIEHAQIADDFHVAPIHSKNESSISR